MRDGAPGKLRGIGLLSIGLVALLAMGTRAHAQVGTVEGGEGTLIGSAKLKVGPGCGKQTSPVTSSLEFPANGGFELDLQGGSFSGSKTAVGSGGRVWRLSFDMQSQASFNGLMETLATVLCGTPVTLASGQVTQFSVVLNKKKTAAKMALAALGMGSTMVGPGTGVYRAKLRGPWQFILWPAP